MFSESLAKDKAIMGVKLLLIQAIMGLNSVPREDL